jgi:hypothetical protein
MTDFEQYFKSKVDHDYDFSTGEWEQSENAMIYSWPTPFKSQGQPVICVAGIERVVFEGDPGDDYEQGEFMVDYPDIDYIEDLEQGMPDPGTPWFTTATDFSSFTDAIKMLKDYGIPPPSPKEYRKYLTKNIPMSRMPAQPDEIKYSGLTDDDMIVADVDTVLGKL